MENSIPKELVVPIFPKEVRPHEVTLSDLINPNLSVLCRAYTIYDVWY